MWNAGAKAPRRSSYSAQGHRRYQRQRLRGQPQSPLLQHRYQPTQVLQHLLSRMRMQQQLPLPSRKKRHPLPPQRLLNARATWCLQRQPIPYHLHLHQVAQVAWEVMPLRRPRSRHRPATIWSGSRLLSRIMAATVCPSRISSGTGSRTHHRTRTCNHLHGAPRDC